MFFWIVTSCNFVDRCFGGTYCLRLQAVPLQDHMTSQPRRQYSTYSPRASQRWDRAFAFICILLHAFVAHVLFSSTFTGVCMVCVHCENKLFLFYSTLKWPIQTPCCIRVCWRANLGCGRRLNSVAEASCSGKTRFILTFFNLFKVLGLLGYYLL